jgi:hypothetical protein
VVKQGVGCRRLGGTRLLTLLHAAALSPTRDGAAFFLGLNFSIKRSIYLKALSRGFMTANENRNSANGVSTYAAFKFGRAIEKTKPAGYLTVVPEAAKMVIMRPGASCRWAQTVLQPTQYWRVMP